MVGELWHGSGMLAGGGTLRQCHALGGLVVEIEHQLAFGLIGEWTQGEQVVAFAACAPGVRRRHRVHGLDQDGLPVEPNRALRAVEVLTDDAVAGAWVAVRGDQPECLAVRFFRPVARSANAFLVITMSRFAVVALCDATSATQGAFHEFTTAAVGGVPHVDRRWHPTPHKAHM
jgi:hypothetical protein